MNAAIGTRVPSTASNASRPIHGPCFPKASHGVGTGENVLVSCCICAMTTRIAAFWHEALARNFGASIDHML
jgi:hypothetical protein